MKNGNKTYASNTISFEEFSKRSHDTPKIQGNEETKEIITETSGENLARSNRNIQLGCYKNLFEREKNFSFLENRKYSFKESSDRKPFNYKSLELSPTKSNINSSYGDLISSIFSRRNEKTYRTCRNSRPKKNLQSQYEKNVLFLQRKKEKLQKLKEELEEEENKRMAGCTFNPKLTKSTQKILSRSQTDSKNFYDKCIEWKYKRERVIQHRYMLKVKKDFEECKFYPTTNKEVHDSVKRELHNKKSDYIYEKNQKWLKKLKENRKKEELEKLEKMRVEQEKFKKKNQEFINRINNRYKEGRTNEEILKRNLTIKKKKKPVLSEELEDIKKLMKDLRCLKASSDKCKTKAYKGENREYLLTRKMKEFFPTEVSQKEKKPNKVFEYKCFSPSKTEEKYKLLMEKYKKEKELK